MITKIALNELLVPRRIRNFAETNIGQRDGTAFADVVGFHAYGDLGLNLRLAAPEEDHAADKYLEILEEYAHVAEDCALQADAALLEVQGERLHFLMPAPELTDDAILNLLRFSIALTQTIYARIEPLAGRDWSGFKMAADHGRAIIISTGRDGEDSVVSLGPAANTPAKRLAHGVSAGHLALPKRLTGRSRLLVGGVAHRETHAWTEINVKTPAQFLQPAVDVALLKRMKEAASGVPTHFSSQRPSVKWASADQFANTNHATVADPIEVQGLCLRADLDGFSAQVQKAFDTGSEQAIRALVERFMLIMQLPEHFAKRMDRAIISLPWAGDCATQLILLKPGESYEDIRRFLPPTSSIAWQSSNGHPDQRLEEIRRAVQTARWSVGIAGGDEDEGSSGRMLVANIRTRTRTFLVAAGWNVRRSLDAQQASHVQAEDTVVHITDCEALSAEFRQVFHDLPDVAIFRRASLSALIAARDKQVAMVGQQRPIVMPNIRAGIVPASKPHVV